jgi:hypothetical protein
MWNFIQNLFAWHASVVIVSFSQMWSSVGVWHTSRMLMHANTLTPVCTPLYLRHRLENAMVSTLNSSEGLFMHWGLYESGKSVAVRHAAQRLQDDHCRTVILRKGYDIPCLFAEDAKCDLSACLGLPSSDFAQFLSKPTTLIIDHFDIFVWYPAKKSKALMHSLLGLVNQARSTPNFNMLLVFNSWEAAKEFRDRTDAKLVAHPGYGRWTVDELLALRNITPLGADCTLSNAADHDEIFNLSVIGGSPSLLHFGLKGNEPLRATQARSQIYQHEWTQGIAALTGGTLTGPGRFPDKDGNFHWDAGRSAKASAECGPRPV